MLKRLEEEDLDDSVKKRLKDSSETPGALWHIYISKDVEKIKDFLHKVILTLICSLSVWPSGWLSVSLAMSIELCLSVCQ